MTDRAKPLYPIGVVAEMLKIHPQTLRMYERKGLIRPSRTQGRTRKYSAEDVEELQRILRLTRDLGVNLAGVEIILKMRRQMLALQEELQELAAYARQQPGATREDGSRAAQLVRVADRGLTRLEVF